MMLDKLKPYCGLFFNVRYERFAFTPNVTPFMHYGIRKALIRTDFGLSPRLVVALNPRWSLDLNAALFLTDFSYESSVSENPALTPTQQRFNYLNADLLSGYQLRIGVARRLSKSKADE